MADKTAILYRMVFPDHICPYGLKAKDLLQRSGYKVDDRHLKSREETDAFKAEHGVKTTPLIFIDGQPVGGYTDLRRYLGKPVPDPDKPSYRAVAVLFSITALMALAASYAVNGEAITVQAAEWFISFSMCILAMTKLQDVEKFATMFLNYDLRRGDGSLTAMSIPMQRGWRVS